MAVADPRLYPGKSWRKGRSIESKSLQHARGAMSAMRPLFTERRGLINPERPSLHGFHRAETPSVWMSSGATFGGAMSTELIRHNRPISDHLHPAVYAAMAGLALWLVVSVWGFA